MKSRLNCLAVSSAGIIVQMAVSTGNRMIGTSIGDSGVIGTTHITILVNGRDACPISNR